MSIDKLFKVLAERSNGATVADVKSDILERTSNIPYKGWDELVNYTMNDYYPIDREDAERLLRWGEDTNAEDAYEKHTSGGSDAWSGGFAKNH